MRFDPLELFFKPSLSPTLNRRSCRRWNMGLEAGSIFCVVVLY